MAPESARRFVTIQAIQDVVAAGYSNWHDDTLQFNKPFGSSILLESLRVALLRAFVTSASRILPLLLLVTSLSALGHMPSCYRSHKRIRNFCYALLVRHSCCFLEKRHLCGPQSWK
eukprot:3384664-Amphidinium_carterae.1